MGEPSSPRPRPLSTPSTPSSPEESVPTPPPHRNVSLRLENTSTHATRALAKANRELSDFKVNAALREYTEVLAKLSPGHPIAFLNRSLCYLLLGFPSLAAMDAYRAILAATYAKDNPRTASQAEHLHRFCQYTVDSDENEDGWVDEPGCYVAGGSFPSLSKPLGSIVVKADIRINLPAILTARQIEQYRLKHLANDVILKAYYRLALALWKCGGGALKSAMDQLTTAQSLPFTTQEDEAEFCELQNKILFDIEKVQKEEKELKVYYLKEVVLKNRSRSHPAFEDVYGIHGLMKTRFTKVKREIYPWDSFSLNTDNKAKVLSDVKYTIAKATKAVSPTTTQEAGRAPKFELQFVDTGINSSQLFTESSAFHVTATSSISSHRAMRCSTCASALDVSGALSIYANKIARELGDSSYRTGSTSPSNSSVNSQDIVEASYTTQTPILVSSNRGNDDDGFRRPALPGQQDVPVFPIQPAGFQLCTACRKDAYCSTECSRIAQEAGHAHICKMSSMNDWLCEKILPDLWPEIPNPIAQRLLALLYARILAYTLHRFTQHPLEAEWIQYLNGDFDAPRTLPQDWDGKSLNPADLRYDDDGSPSLNDLFPHRDLLANPKGQVKEQNNMIPWSFHTNVEQPLMTLLGLRDISTALDVRRYDGWMLETLRTRVAENMRVTAYPRFEKAYDDRGNLVASASVTGVSYANPYAARPFGPDISAEEKETACVASLHPLTSLIRVAGGNEDPNISVSVRGGKLLVTGTQSADAMDLDAPSLLLRARDIEPVVENGDVGVKEYRFRAGATVSPVQAFGLVEERDEEMSSDHSGDTEVIPEEELQAAMQAAIGLFRGARG